MIVVALPDVSAPPLHCTLLHPTAPHYVARLSAGGSDDDTDDDVITMTMTPTITTQLRALVQQSDASGVQQKTPSPYDAQASSGDSKKATATTTVSFVHEVYIP